MFGSLGMPELILIFIVALLIFGPKKLPEIGKSIGKGLAEFKKASDELKKTIEQEMEQVKNEGKTLKDTVAQSTAWSAPTASDPATPPPTATEPSPPDSRPINPA